MKKGFTLAEVLVTIGIIGVVSALTLPALNTNFRKQQAEVAYAKAVNMFTTANKLLLNDTQTRTLDVATGADPADNDYGASVAYIRAIAPYLNATSGINERTEIYHFNLTGLDSTISEKSNNYYITKGGEMSFFPRGAFIPGYYEIFIDVNGPNKAPNAIGRDVFLFVVDRRTGDIYGYGTTQLAVFREGGSQEHDNSDNGCNEDNVNHDWACGGSIMDHGGKIIYKF